MEGLRLGAFGREGLAEIGSTVGEFELEYNDRGCIISSVVEVIDGRGADCSRANLPRLLLLVTLGAGEVG